MCKGISKTILVVLNIVTLAAGILITTAGGLLMQGSTLFRSVITKAIDILKKPLNIDQAQIDKIFDDTVNFVISNAKPLAIPLIVLGVFVMLVSLFGIVGACCSNRCLLISYAIVIALVMLAHIIIVIVVRVKEDEIKAEIKKFMRDSLVSKYKGLTSQEVQSFFVNLIQIEGQCCGVDNYRDFADYAAGAGKQVVIPSVSCYTSRHAANPQPMNAPLTCCNLKDCDSSAKVEQCVANRGLTPADASNANKGCWSWIETTLWSPAVKYMLISLVALVFYVLLIVLVAIILKKNKD